MDTNNYSHLVREERWSFEEAYKKWFWARFILLLIALALTLIVAYIYFIKLPKYQKLADEYLRYPVNTQTHQTAPLPSDSVLPSMDITKWPTYTNTQYHFTFNYPTLNVQSTTDKNVTEIDIPSINGKLFIASAPTTLFTNKNILTDFDAFDSASVINMIVAVNGKQVSAVKMGNDARVLFKHKNIFYAFIYTAKDSIADARAQTVLSTFTFGK